MTFDESVRVRAGIFIETVDRVRPHVVVVDRHPLGAVGELREGIEMAARQGSALVLGLRDILDDASAIGEEMRGDDWSSVPDLFAKVLVYGTRGFCDHEDEYGLPVRPTYCGWVVDAPVRRDRDPRLLAAAAGGGGDGAAVFRLATQAVRRRPSWRGEVAVGPFADATAIRRAALVLKGRLKVHEAMSECRALYARAGALVQMAGYNSTFEALRAGLRPVLVPRRHPRREQAIRAERLASLGLVDIAEPETDPDDLLGLLDRPRTVTSTELARSGLDMRGAERAAAYIRLVAKGVSVE